MGLPVITDTNAAKVNEFYKNLLYNTQALETLGKLDKVSGMTRSVLEKLKGIKADLVRGSEGWQDWDLTRLIAELKKWRDINPVEDNPNSKKQRKSGFYHANDGDRRKRATKGGSPLFQDRFSLHEASPHEQPYHGLCIVPQRYRGAPFHDFVHPIVLSPRHLFRP